LSVKLADKILFLEGDPSTEQILEFMNSLIGSVPFLLKSSAERLDEEHSIEAVSS